MRAHAGGCHRRAPAGLVRRFSSFSMVGAFVFAAGLVLQAGLVQLGAGSYGSYAGQAVPSILLSFALSRLFVWPDRDVRLWSSCWRFCMQKLLLTVPSLALYAVLVHLGSGWLIASVMTTVVFTVLNYVLSDRWSFSAMAHNPRRLLVPVRAAAAIITARSPAHRPVPVPAVVAGFARTGPTVSVVIPCRGNECTILAAVEALLAQDYRNLEEVILVGDTGDSTWSALAGITDPRLIMLEQELTPGKCDPNVKRDKGLCKAHGKLLALSDSDIVMNPGWLSTAVPRLLAQGGGVMAGGMRSIRDSFWGRFVDRNVIAAKTPRVPRSYTVTIRNFGRRHSYPPVTANAVFTRDVYDAEPLDVTWAYGYEDYEWFWRVAEAGFRITFAPDISGAHHHRRSFRRLATEYRRSANGCAHFIRAHPSSPLARKRRRQALLLPVAAIAGAALAGVMAASGGAVLVAFITACAMLALAGREVATSRRLEAAVYPLAGLALAAVFTWGLSSDLLMRRNVVYAKPYVAPLWDKPARAESVREPPRRRVLAPAGRRISWPLTVILALQAGLSLSLVWSNTAFPDEADYLWQGRMEWAHWLHGNPLPTFGVDSGAPQVYPPLGAIANVLGGLPGARILSLCFMLAATAFLYLIASRLFDKSTAIMGSALWGVTEPVLRLAFATYDPMACFLVILSVWLGVQAVIRHWRGELIALSALSLALASITAFSFAIMIPAVAAILFFSWQYLLDTKAAIWCVSWLVGTTGILVVATLSILHLWQNILNATVNRSEGLANGLSTVVNGAWYWDGLLLAVSLTGVVLAFATERTWSRKLLILSLMGSGLLVVAYQAYLGTSWSLDKHMSAGTGFMAIPAGYAFSRAKLASWKPVTVWCAVGALLLYPAISGLWYARSTFHSWPTTSPLISLVDSSMQAGGVVVSNPQGTFFVVQYYAPALYKGTPNVPGINGGVYSNVVLTLDASFNSVSLPKSAASGNSANLPGEILQLATTYAGNREEYPLLVALGHSHRYRIIAAIPYTTTIPSNSTGLFVVWQRMQ